MRKKLRPFLEEDSSEESLINLTPLIDVVFVVLIAFMLIAPILHIDKVELAEGASPSQNPLNSSPISISVHADDTIWYQNNQIALTQLESLLQQKKKQNPKAIPQISYDKKASFGTYQSLKNSLEKIGFEQMELILKPK